MLAGSTDNTQGFCPKQTDQNKHANRILRTVFSLQKGTLLATVKQQVMERLERVQRRTRELGKDVEDKPSEEVLREL